MHPDYQEDYGREDSEVSKIMKSLDKEFVPRLCQGPIPIYPLRFSSDISDGTLAFSSEIPFI